MAQETYDRAADPGGSGVEYEYGGGTGDYERGEYSPGTDGLEDTDFSGDGELDASDTLDGNPGDDPLDTGIAPPDKWSAGERFGTTLAEEREGESLDQLLAEEESEPDPYADPGRLVAEDEGAHPDSEPDLVARDVGIDGGAAGAEEAAVHLTDEDEDEIAGGPEG